MKMSGPSSLSMMWPQRSQAFPVVGDAGQKKLLSSSVFVVGAGGLGSSALLCFTTAVEFGRNNDGITVAVSPDTGFEDILGGKGNPKVSTSYHAAKSPDDRK